METNIQLPQRLFVQPVRYEIPIFQRRYVWTQEDQWEPLWDDVEKLAQSIVDGDQPEPHFMGAIVLQQKLVAAATIERRIVVDGQQRLTTLQLLIDAIQEVLECRGYSDPSRRLAALVTNGEEYRDGKPDYAFKVWPTVVDQEAFRHAMNNDLPVTDHVASRIVQAHQYFKGQAERWLERFLDDTESGNRAANALDQAVSTKLEVVVIDLGGTDDPHVIFETLNARGTPLLQSDMVKNKVLHDAGVGPTDDDSQASGVEKQLWPFDEAWWAQEVGRGLQRRPRVDVYLNHWLTLRNRREMKAYDEFSAFEAYAKKKEPEGTEGETIEEIAQDLGSIGRIYRDVEDICLPGFAQFLERRKVMNAGVVTPLLLWLLSAEVPSTTLANCFRALESFLVRRALCGYSARSHGEVFVSLIKSLAGEVADNADRIIISHLDDRTAQAALWPDDQELLKRFVNVPLYRFLPRGRLRMVLTAIEHNLRTNKAETQEVPGNLHIEHVMPQAWHLNWPLPDHASGDEDAGSARERAIHTIGNLTLVNGRLNSSLSNAPWDRKRTTLQDHSVLFLNKWLVTEGPEEWDETAIKNRSEWFYAQAAKIWPHAKNFET